MFYLYILYCNNQFFYVGITKNLSERIEQHKSGRSRYTKRYSEINLVYYEKHKKRIDAEKREIQIKGWSKKKKQALIEGNVEKLIDLAKSRP